MRQVAIVLVLFMAISGCSFFSSQKEKTAPEKAIAHMLIMQTDSFLAAKNKLLTAVSNNVDENQLQQLFLQTRLAYKKIEWAAEYFDPATSRLVNGAPVPEVEVIGNQVFDPAGLQVIEALLFPRYNVASGKKELLRQLNLLQGSCDNYKSYFNNIDILDGQVFDAAKLEVFRILTLGITGFDNPLTQKSMTESATALKSLQDVMAHYDSQQESADLRLRLTAAISYLKQNTNFNSFDRARFITGYGNAISTSITILEKKLKIHTIKYNRLLRQEASTLFDKDAFNANAYEPVEPGLETDKKIALGKKLFADPILSGTNIRSCASCHRPDKAFADGLVKNTVINSKAPLRRNTPTLLNAALQPAQFYDLRANTLEEQVSDVVQNRDEMHGSMTIAVNRLWRNKEYRQMFTAAFPMSKRTGIDTSEVMNAIGSFVRSLTMLNSRFDEYMRGNKTAMNQEEINGFNLFMGKAKCATCHYMPLFNGTFPPRYVKMETEVIGVPSSKTNTAIDQDLGRYDIVPLEFYKHAFKTVTVRNAARNAPYMHNGVFATLDEVMDFYNKGGGAGLGIKVNNQTLPLEQLHLTATETKAVIAFIKSLDSR
ncbi:cytochrome c peroxidase [Mucilaginibacter sp. SP1R1]|uniref:cytochrome c peroxidase n=1 Tax=Mucilaginibacter sp. SP1R1 TaxID=2723091 RepID=UPI001622DEAA|nr:cytochrome c peroxidase [Mucilaginibacter sp. SP1R1]MBB6148563.1 cytochrome c peroxidase [Mucilaginibacter sp. SP1R1]